MTESTRSNTASEDTRTGLLLALAAYGMWGFFPAYYKLTTTVSSDVIVAHRIVWSVLFVGAFLIAVKRWNEVTHIFRSPALIARLTASACFIGVNWLVFVWAIGQGRVLEISLGYFINPLVSILLGLVVLHEKLTRLQVVAVGLAALAVALQAALVGGLPWVSLVLAVSFAGYGYVRKVTPVKATPGLFIETVLLFPLALGYLLLVQSWGDDALILNDRVVLIALVGTGILTALPLICFSAAARRLPMVLVGLLQYIAPSIHFLMAVYIWHEPLQRETLTTFVFIWVALAVFSFDSWQRWRANARASQDKPQGLT